VRVIRTGDLIFAVSVALSVALSVAVPLPFTSRFFDNRLTIE
jgi:hypothetical protein